MRKVIRTAIFGCIIAVLIISFYVYLSKRTTSNEETAEPEKVTAMDEVLNKDFQEDYPGTPRSVIKWYNKIVKLYYNDDATDEQVIDLADKARELWDDELSDANPRDTYLTALKEDIADYQKHDRVIASTDVCDSDEVKYYTYEGSDMASVIASYFVTEGSGYSKVYQKYALRKDDNGNYKIVAFELCDSEGNPLDSGTVITPGNSGDN